MTAQFRYSSLLTMLIICALLLTARVGYLFLADCQRFPINTIKITANYQHITREQLQYVLSQHLNNSFFSLSISELYEELRAFEWTSDVVIDRIWPDTLKITLTEKTPVAIWNDELLTPDGNIFKISQLEEDSPLPRLRGPKNQQQDVLQIYQKLSKLLSIHGLHARALQLRDNQAWELSLTNGVQIQLGKQALEERLLRFCRAYPAVIADKSDEQLESVDLRYARGMAVHWKQPMGR